MDLRTNFVPEADDFRGISLCAGYGGLVLGLHIAEPNYRTVAFVERESHAAAALVARMADQAMGEAPIWDDLRTFDAAAWRGRVHLVSAGYPCQPFSYAGRRGGEADPRHLWPEVARIVDEAQPEWVWCENVEGHLSMGYSDVAASLRSLGYTPKAGLFTAREAGARHRRRRLFILAHADRLRCRLRSGHDDRGREAEGGVTDRHLGGSGGQFALNEASRSWTTLWSLLKAMGWSAATATSLSSHPVRVSFKNGKRSFLTGLTSNPRFYEMIMGWPIGWTAPGEQVTAYAAWLQRSRSQFSRLLTNWTPDRVDV